jgi:hypothetical protein
MHSSTHEWARVDDGAAAKAETDMEGVRRKDDRHINQLRLLSWLGIERVLTAVLQVASLVIRKKLDDA